MATLLVAENFGHELFDYEACGLATHMHGIALNNKLKATSFGKTQLVEKSHKFVLHLTYEVHWFDFLFALEFF